MIDEDKIIDYVMDELDETERDVVAAALEKDGQLQETAEKYQQIKSGFRAKRVSKLMDQINAYEDSATSASHSDQNLEQLSPNRKNRLLQLVLLAFITLSIAFFYGRTNYSDVALAKKYFLMPADPSVAGGQEVSIFLSGIEAFFNDQDYSRAVSLFTSLPESNVYSRQARYFQAHANFLSHDYEKALAEFNQLASQVENYLPEQQRRIKWNELVSSLANGKDISPLSSQWAESTEGQALERDLESIWRKIFY